MKRLWPLPVLLLLALPLRAQEGDAAASDSAAEEGAAPSAAEPNSAEGQPPQDGAAANGGEEGGDPGEKPVKEEPLISVKVAAPVPEEGDEESVAPAAPEKKVSPTATIMKAPKKAKAAPNKAKLAQGTQGAPSVVKSKAPAVAPEPPPPPVPAVPLTPITPRNP